MRLLPRSLDLEQAKGLTRRIAPHDPIAVEIDSADGDLLFGGRGCQPADGRRSPVLRGRATPAPKRPDGGC